MSSCKDVGDIYPLVTASWSPVHVLRLIALPVTAAPTTFLRCKRSGYCKCAVLSSYGQPTELPVAGQRRRPALPRTASLCVQCKEWALLAMSAMCGDNQVLLACPAGQTAWCTICAPLFNSCSVLPFKRSAEHLCRG